ncbi:MAG: GNAT family N-acetyltransferase [Eubacteriales bacterium]|nr:GNAT family N-acetyltransferase [Eubacteriales bacterium]
MFDRSMPNVSLEMRARLEGEIPEWTLPEGYGLRRFRAGEELAWSEIETTAEEFEQVEDALRRGFGGSFQPDYLLVDGRMYFVVDENDRPVATATAWFDGEVGMLHWVAVHSEHQGKGLARPVIAAALRRMQELGYAKAMLHTQPMSWLAIKLYMEFGFRPVWPEDEKTLEGWKAVFAKLGKEFCKEECADGD